MTQPIVVYIGIMPRLDGAVGLSVHMQDGPPPPTPMQIAMAAMPDKTFKPDELKQAQSLGPFPLPEDIIERLLFANKSEAVLQALAAMLGRNEATPESDEVQKLARAAQELISPPTDEHLEPVRMKP